MSSKLFRLKVMMAISVLAVMIAGCSRLELSSEAYELATALDRVLEKQDVAQLQLAEEIIQARHQAGQLRAAEAEQLQALVAMAKDRDWTGARSKLRRVLADQADW